MAEWNYNYKSDNWTMPIGPKVGKVTELGKLPVNLFGAVFYQPLEPDDAPSVKWKEAFDITLLSPK